MGPSLGSRLVGFPSPWRCRRRHCPTFAFSLFTTDSIQPLASTRNSSTPATGTKKSFDNSRSHPLPPPATCFVHSGEFFSTTFKPLANDFKDCATRAGLDLTAPNGTLYPLGPYPWSILLLILESLIPLCYSPPPASAMELSSPPHRLATDLHESDFSDFVEDDQDTVLTSKSPYFTQPTQIVQRPTLKPKAPRAPSPDPIVEVPASSPFRPHSALANGGRLANAMAPAGTAFRPPARIATDGSLKRSIIMISDDELDTPTYKRGDSSDDENGRPARGDIRPSSFQAKKQKLSAEVVKGPPKTQPLNTVSELTTLVLCAELMGLPLTASQEAC